MTIKSIFKIIVAALIFFVVFFVYPNYADDRRIEKSREKLRAENIDLELEGFKFGITKNEFYNNYGNTLDSLVDEKHSTEYHSDTNPKIIKTFHGLNVSKEEFLFRGNIFNRLFHRTDILSCITVHIKDSSYENFMQLKSDFDKHKQGSHSQWSSEPHLVLVSYYNINKHLKIELRYGKDLDRNGNKINEDIVIICESLDFV